MKVKLIYNLPEESSEYNYAMNGAKYSCAIDEFDDYLRAELKYNSDKLSKEEYEQIETIRTKFNEILNNNGVSTHE